MEKKSGDNRVQTDMTGYGESSGKQNQPTAPYSGTSLMVGSSNIDDAIQMHLVDCQKCRYVTEHGKPVPNVRIPNGRKDGHCDAYWQLQLMRANYEGMVNNIVAHTELGDEPQYQPRDLEGQ